MSDQFTSRYEELLEGQYDCVDRVVVNASCPVLREAEGSGTGGGHCTGRMRSATTNT
jgi:hypothetical protein